MRARPVCTRGQKTREGTASAVCNRHDRWHRGQLLETMSSFDAEKRPGEKCGLRWLRPWRRCGRVRASPRAGPQRSRGRYRGSKPAPGLAGTSPRLKRSATARGAGRATGAGWTFPRVHQRVFLTDKPEHLVWAIIRRMMIVTLQTERLRPVEQIRVFLNGAGCLGPPWPAQAHVPARREVDWGNAASRRILLRVAKNLTAPQER